jgi:AcrR family transcriptional regulator
MATERTTGTRSRLAGPTALAAPDEGPDVPRRLLEAASRLFADRGYDGTTVRDVVARASTNLNAVNYHFGSKEQLYAAVMKYQAELAEQAHPRNKARKAPASHREALARCIEDTVSWLLDPDLLLPALYARELINPSAAFNFANVGSSEHEALRAAVAGLLGPRASGEDIDRCARSVYSLCAYFMFTRRVLPMMDPGFRYSARTVKALAAHITDFALGGIEALRAQIGRRPKAPGRG